jgi:hypothetical protein
MHATRSHAVSANLGPSTWCRQIVHGYQAFRPQTDIYKLHVACRESKREEACGVWCRQRALQYTYHCVRRSVEQQRRGDEVAYSGRCEKVCRRRSQHSAFRVRIIAVIERWDSVLVPGQLPSSPASAASRPHGWQHEPYLPSLKPLRRLPIHVERCCCLHSTVSFRSVAVRLDPEPSAAATVV